MNPRPEPPRDLPDRTCPRTWVLRLAPEEDRLPERLSDLPTRAAAESLLGASAVSWGVAVGRDAADYIADNVPLFGSEPGALELLRRAVEASFLAALRALYLEDVEAMWPSTEPADAIASFVRRRVPLQDVLRGIHLSQEILTSRVLEALPRLVAADALPEESRDSTELIFRCFDRFGAHVTTFYSLESERWARSSTAAKDVLLDRVLNSPSFTDVTGAGATLGLSIDAPAVAMVVWLSDRHPGHDAAQRTQRAVDAIVRAARRPRHLTRWTGPSTVHLWLQGDHTRILEDLRTMDPSQLGTARVAVGRCCDPDLAGFRFAHRTALAAESVARAARTRLPWLVEYRSVQLTALLLKDMPGLRAFISDQLGGLARQDERMQELRTTLDTYLSSGRSVNRASQALHTHRNTVVYRVKSAESLLNPGTDVESIELRAALRIADTLGDAVLAPAATTPATTSARSAPAR